MNSSYRAHIFNMLKTLPESPGVYQFFDHTGTILYVGKAKNLKKRVSSYFQKKSHESFKVRVLVKKVADIRHIVVDSESDALLLENNLIKKFQPRYNVLLKDDKTFPWICVKNEEFPRVFLTRNVIRDGSRYFGPYTSASTARTLLELIRSLYPLRTCKYHLSDENIREKKYKVCLEYHLGNCMGPCEGLQDKVDYSHSIDQIQQILKGNLHEVISHLKDKMKSFADEYRFEEAESVRKKIESIQQFQVKTTIVNPAISNVDVFSIEDQSKYAVVNYLKILEGAVVQSHTAEIRKRLNETTREILAYAIIDIRERVDSAATEIILPQDLSEELPWFKIYVPQRGDKKKLLELSRRNARMYVLEKNRRSEYSDRNKSTKQLLELVQRDLRLKHKPLHIECFDNSNFQGSQPVAACVVFRNGRPSKKEYRHYNIKTVTGADDFASMSEVVYRRYDRLLQEEKTLPQLVIIDGGKGQLNAAVKSLKKLGIEKEVGIIGIAKKLEEIYFPGDPVPLYIDKNSGSLRVIQYLRNEAHRFGIQFHRQKRSGDMAVSELQSIKGIGQDSIQKLFKKYGSLDQIMKVNENDLAALLDKKKANLLTTYFKTKK